MLIESLSEEQISKFSQYRQDYINYGLSTTQSSAKDKINAINLLYTKAGLTPPKDIIFATSPIDCIKQFIKYYKNNGVKITQKIIEDQLLNFCYGSQESSWLSFYSFFKNETILKDELFIIDGLLECMKHCGWFLPYNNFCIVGEKPAKINLDVMGNLHSETEKCIEYSDGFGFYAIHGVVVPEWIILTPQLITPQLIDEEKNIEIRRVMIVKYGASEYLKNSKYEVINKDKDQFGRQRRLLLKKGINRDEEDILRVQVINSSPELLDKTYKEYLIPVDFECRPLLKDFDEKAKFMTREEKIQNGYLGNPQELTCHNAVASTFGKYGHEYGLRGQIRQGDVFIEFKDGSNNLPFRES